MAHDAAFADGLPRSHLFHIMGKEAFPLETILEAIRLCARNVSWKASVVRWTLPQNMVRFAIDLKKQLAEGTYRIAPYTEFYITEPKRRRILSPKFRDRVVQRAMLLDGVFDALSRPLIPDTMACLPGRGTKAAVGRMSEMIRSFLSRSSMADAWVLKLDIRKFFDSIDHAILKKLLDKLDIRPEYRTRLDEVVDSFSAPGIGLGVEISHHLANYYLSGFDHFIKERLRIREYIRYADDMVLLGSKKQLQSARHQIERKLSELKLELNAKSTLHPLSQGLIFLKFHFRIVDGLRIIRLVDRATVSRYKRHISKKIIRMNAGEFGKEKIEQSFQSWKSHALWGNARKTIESTRRYINARLHAHT